jgi:hypothetical protein
MIIYYPTYYLVPVIPVISIDEDEYSAVQGDDYRAGYNEEYGCRFNMEENEVHKTYRNIDEDIFGEADEEYVNESTK